MLVVLSRQTIALQVCLVCDCPQHSLCLYVLLADTSTYVWGHTSCVLLYSSKLTAEFRNVSHLKSFLLFSCECTWRVCTLVRCMWTAQMCLGCVELTKRMWTAVVFGVCDWVQLPLSGTTGRDLYVWGHTSYIVYTTISHIVLLATVLWGRAV
jgi:hypothetical protein